MTRWDRLLNRIRRSSTRDLRIPDCPDELAAVIRVIAADSGLQAWFRHVSSLPTSARVSAVSTIVSEMTAEGEDERFIEAFRMLSDEKVCRAVAEILRQTRTGF